MAVISADCASLTGRSNLRAEAGLDFPVTVLRNVACGFGGHAPNTVVRSSFDKCCNMMDQTKNENQAAEASSEDIPFCRRGSD